MKTLSNFTKATGKVKVWLATKQQITSNTLLSKVLLLSLIFFLAKMNYCYSQDDSNLRAQNIWAVGLNVGFAEHGAFYNVNPSFVVDFLNGAISFADRVDCIPSDGLTDLRNRMRQASSSRSLYNEILTYRQQLADIILRDCSCIESPGGCADLSGKWNNRLSWITTIWTLTKVAGNRYNAQEQGGCNASGPATLVGNRLRIDWRCGNSRGTYEWNLNRDCSAGSGTLVSAIGTHESTLTRKY